MKTITEQLRADIERMNKADYAFTGADRESLKPRFERGEDGMLRLKDMDEDEDTPDEDEDIDLFEKGVVRIDRRPGPLWVGRDNQGYFAYDGEQDTEDFTFPLTETAVEGLTERHEHEIDTRVTKFTRGSFLREAGDE